MIGVDTSIIIDILRKHIVLEKLQNYTHEDLWTSEVVAYELLYGAYASKEMTAEKIKYAEAILDTFITIVPINRKAVIEAAKIGGRLTKQGQMIDHMDILIAGGLLAHGCKKFLTKDKQDFERIKELDVLSL